MRCTHLLVMLVSELLHTCKTGTGRNTYGINMWTYRSTFCVQLTYKLPLRHTCTHTHEHMLRSPTPILSNKFWQQHFAKPLCKVGVGKKWKSGYSPSIRPLQKLSPLLPTCSEAINEQLISGATQRAIPSTTWRWALATTQQLYSQC